MNLTETASLARTFAAEVDAQCVIEDKSVKRTERAARLGAISQTLAGIAAQTDKGTDAWWSAVEARDSIQNAREALLS